MIAQNFIQLLNDSFVKFWNEPIYSDYQKDGVFLYRDVAQRIAKNHIFFRQLGIKPEDKISLLGRNTSDWAITYLSIVTYGCVVVPIMPDFNPEDVHHIVVHSDSVLLYVGEFMWPLIQEVEMPEIKAIVSLNNGKILNKTPRKEIVEIYNTLDERFNSEFPNGVSADNLGFASVDNSRLMVINYTSGTSGFSKGVMIPANSLVGNITYAQRYIPIDEKSKIVSFLPMAHTYGCAFDFLLPIIMGCQVIFLNKIPSPTILISAFQEHKPQIIFTVPLVLEKIYRKKIVPVISKPTFKFLLSIPGVKNLIYKKICNQLLQSFGGEIREVVIGGAALNAEVEHFLSKIKFPYAIGYGMTECGPLISYDGNKTTRLYSCGKALDIMTVKIDSVNPITIPGEILTRGENLMLGYYKNNEATKLSIDADGWLHTGDMGIVDKDGYIYIKGRYKSMLLGSNGQNIYPEEVEAKLNNLPYVLESVLISDNDNKLVALVYPDVEAVEKDGVTAEKLIEIMEHNRKHLNKVVRSYEMVTRFKIHNAEFEKTPKRSIKRFLYKDSY